MAFGYRSGSYANNGVGTAPFGQGTTPITVGTALSAGDLIVLAIGSSSNIADNRRPDSFSVSDTVNGAWGSKEVVTLIWGWNGTNNRIRSSLWAFPNSAAGTPVITVTINASFTSDTYNTGLQVAAFSGIATSSAFDTGASATDTTANPSSGAVSPATGAANELMVTFYWDAGENSTLAVGNINGTTATLAGKHDADGGKYQALLEYGDSGSSGGTPSGTITAVDPGADFWSMLSAVFKITGGGPAAPIPDRNYIVLQAVQKAANW